jgi:outer membrane protein assembly factor BamB
MNNDDTVELVIGDYSGILHCFNAFNGELNWQYQFPTNSLYIACLAASIPRESIIFF